MNRLLVNPQCVYCWDSGIAGDLRGINQCRQCNASLGPVSYRLFGCLSNLQLKGKEINDQMLVMARAIVPFSFAEPVMGKDLADLLMISERQVKRLAKQIRDEWQLPICTRREPPYGYYFAAKAEEFLDWLRTTKSQAISELATAYHLFKSNFPELAGQQSLEFVNTVSSELQEALR